MRVELEIPDAILHHLLDGVPIPDMALVHHTMPTPPALPNPGEVLWQELQNLSGTVCSGQRIAVGVGSRGVADLPEMVGTLIRWLRDQGAEPFIFPAMGSHGGATAGGQREVLEHLGITPDRVGAPISSQMETVVIGRTEDGMPVHLDRLAAQADGIVFVARIKPHTAFHGSYESGLAKMIAIGLGKQAGAAATHARGFGEMARMVPAMAQVALEHAPILFGVGVLENAYDRIFQINVVPADRILAEEPSLLEAARNAMPRLPFERLDVLVIDQIGKNISGDGADPNITGRFPTPYATGTLTVDKQVVLDLTDATAGNANGMGTADFTTVRLVRKVNLGATYPNALTSTVPGPVKIPMILPSDRLAFQAAILTCHAVNRPPRIVRIQDTLHLGEFWISSGLLQEAAQNPNLTVQSPPAPLQFDQQGNLQDLEHLASVHAESIDSGVAI